MLAFSLGGFNFASQLLVLFGSDMHPLALLIVRLFLQHQKIATAQKSIQEATRKQR